MIEIPDPPKASRIWMRRRADDVHLRWRTTSVLHVLTERLLEVLWGGWAALFAFVAVRVGAEILTDTPVPILVLEAVFFFVATATVASFIAASADFRVRWSREELDIAGDILTHRAAMPSPGVLRLLFTKDFREGPVDKEALREAGVLLERGRSIHVLRSYVEGVELQGEGSFEVLALVIEERDLHVGQSLSHEEREWLASVLRRWLDAAPRRR
jgi:hypothetical protein